MNIITITNEAKRGCGFRKEGGLYLRSDGLSRPCGRLPLPLTVCPTCHAGIKPSRGWTWVDAFSLFRNTPCKFDQDLSLGNNGCACPLGSPPIKAGLLWIGEAYYKTPDDWIAEGHKLGVSRRISAVPKGFEIGKTLVLCAHRKAIREEVANPEALPGIPDIKWTPGIIHAFVPQRLEYVVRKGDSEKKLEALASKGITLVRLERTDGCDSVTDTDRSPPAAG